LDARGIGDIQDVPALFLQASPVIKRS